MIAERIKELLELKVLEYNTPAFIAEDPIQVPHRFSLKEDREIAGFLAATIAWGNRTTILKSAARMMELMGHSPYDFVMSHREKDLARLDGFVHRTFNADDLAFFISALRKLYLPWDAPQISSAGIEVEGPGAEGGSPTTQKNGGLDNGLATGLEGHFTRYQEEDSLQGAIHQLKQYFFESSDLPYLQRTRKHLPDPGKGSAAKRINMFLRWMVRRDDAGVDLGIWKSIDPSKLSCPLDVHTGNVARKLGLLNRKQDDAKAVQELDTALRKMDPKDPVKYDFALFGLGRYEGLK